MSLKEYKEKRNFKATNEPEGSVKKSKTSRFVIQYHQARAKHYDFRLEYDGVLLSWAVPKGLSIDPKEKRLAVHVEDHPIDYINFEGIIPKGNYGAGTVEVFDKGSYTPLKDMKKALKTGHIKVFLDGEKLKGGWSLVKIEDDNWLAIKMEDEFAEEADKASKKRNSKLPFTKCKLSLATLSQKVPKGKEWISEIKYDGYRIISYVENGKAQMLSRNDKDYTYKFKSIASALKEIEQDSFVVDGEVVAFDEKGRSDFGLLQTSIKKNNGDFYYVIFDLLALNGEDLRKRPLLDRKKKLEILLHKSSERLMYSLHVDNAEECFEFAKKNNLEGIVAKKSDSFYTGGRSEDWLKIKNVCRQEFVIAGYTTSSKNELISALILGYYDGEKLKYIGKVGTGLNEKDKADLHEKFSKITAKTCPFDGKPPLKSAVWLKPSYVAEVKFTELTKIGQLRQPSFVGLRADKNAKDVTLEVSRGNRDNESK